MDFFNDINNQFNQFTFYPKKYHPPQADDRDCLICAEPMNRYKDRNKIAFHRAIGGTRKPNGLWELAIWAEGRFRNEAEMVHAFHAECIKRAYTFPNGKLCPLCRQSIDIRPLYIPDEDLVRNKAERATNFVEFKALLGDITSTVWQTVLTHNALSIAALGVLCYAARNGDPFYEDDKRLAAIETAEGAFYATASAIVLMAGTTALYAAQRFTASLLGINTKSTPAQTAIEARRKGELSHLKYFSFIASSAAISACITKGLGYNESNANGCLIGTGLVGLSALFAIISRTSPQTQVIEEAVIINAAPAHDPEAEDMDDDDAHPEQQLA